MPNDFFYHGANLNNKITSNYKGLGEEFSQFKNQFYEPYKALQVQINGIEENQIREKIRLFSEYYNHVDTFTNQLHQNRGIKITSQSKFRPTILEEFCGILFKDVPEVNNLGLDFFNKKVFAGIVLDRNGNAKLKTKDIDFCIGKRFDIIIGDQSHEIIIPIIAIECKTYIDKTMFSESQFTAQKMKNGSPNVRVYCIAERNEIDPNEIPTKGQTPLDQIFIIRGRTTNPINADAVLSFFNEVKIVLEKLSRDVIRNELGGILPD